MARDTVEEFSSTPADNTVIADISIQGSNNVSNFDNALRTLMSLVHDDSTQRVKSAGFRNKLINPLGTINQRGYVSAAATTAANQYTVDRWYVVTSGQALSWTESAGVRTFTAPAGGVGQKIEGANLLSGTHTISWTGTATCTVDGVAKVSGDTVTLTGGTDCAVIFSGGTFSKPQLEPGAYATEFEQRPYPVELDSCQWYFERLQTTPGNDGALMVAQAISTGACAGYIPYRLKRIIPAVSWQSDLQFIVSTASGTRNVSTAAVIYSPGATSTRRNGFFLRVDRGATFAAGNAVLVFIRENYIDIDAEVTP